MLVFGSLFCFSPFSRKFGGVSKVFGVFPADSVQVTEFFLLQTRVGRNLAELGVFG